MQENLLQSLQTLQRCLNDHAQSTHQQLHTAMKLNTEILSEHMRELTRTTEQRLQQISGTVEKRLEQGFEKTTATFNDVITRLALIDEAQKKITELSTNVVSLQSVLTNRASRGAFGEVQLTSLVRNMLPESHFSLQHTLANGKRADCMLYLPEPTGNIVIDAKFPL
jgi:DNA recombination protein RmuC